MTALEGSDGPFTVTVVVQPAEPKVGSVHIKVTPVYSDTLDPVRDAQVSILATGREGEEVFSVFAINTPEEPRHYHANLLIEHIGVWAIEITVSEDGQGVGEFEFTLDVSEDQPNAGRLGTALWAGIVAVVVGGGVYVAFAIRRSQRLRDSA